MFLNVNQTGRLLFRPRNRAGHIARVLAGSQFWQQSNPEVVRLQFHPQDALGVTVMGISPGFAWISVRALIDECDVNGSHVSVIGAVAVVVKSPFERAFELVVSVEDGGM